MFDSKNYYLGAQNFYSSKVGSFTGEVNLESLNISDADKSKLSNHLSKVGQDASKMKSTQLYFNSDGTIENIRFKDLGDLGSGKVTGNSFTVDAFEYSDNVLIEDKLII